MVDVIYRATMEPKPDLYEASLGLRSGGQMGGGYIRGGVVKLPDLWYHGVSGGYKPRFEAGMAFGPTLPGRHVFEMGVGVNDAELLSVFPYAYNAIQFHIRAGL